MRERNAASNIDRPQKKCGIGEGVGAAAGAWPPCRRKRWLSAFWKRGAMAARVAIAEGAAGALARVAISEGAAGALARAFERGLLAYGDVRFQPVGWLPVAPFVDEAVGPLLSRR